MKGTHDSTWDFDQTYTEVFPILIKIIYRMTGSMEVAEELSQEAFIKLYERLGGIPAGNDTKYWLIRVGKNLALNHLKRKGRERKAYVKVLQEPPREGDSGETSLLKKDASERVQEALTKLPDKLKEVLILKEYGDLNYKEIASILRISEGNVKVRVYRARERLADFYRKTEGDDVS